MSTFRRSLPACLVIGVAFAGLVATGCSSDKKASPTSTCNPNAPTSAPTSTSTPVTYPPVKPLEGADEQGQIAQAGLAARFLAQNTLKLGPAATDLAKVRGALKTHYPNVTLADAQTVATPTKVSSDVTEFDPTKPPSVCNRKILTFAVADTHNMCVGVVFHGYPVPNEIISFVNAPMGPCNGKNATVWGRGRVPR